MSEQEYTTIYLRTREGYYYESIRIQNGEVIYFDHDSSTGYGGGYMCLESNHSGFTRYVRIFMENLIKSDPNEYKKMHKLLKGQWNQLSENIRAQALKNATDALNF